MYFSDNDSQDYEISSINNFISIKENLENEIFTKEYNLCLTQKKNSNNIIDESLTKKINSNLFLKNSENIHNFSNLNKNNINNNKNGNIFLGKKHEKKFKVNKINTKREITFITFNTKFNKYLTEKINKKISENNIEYKDKKSYFTDENPILSTKFTQCGIQKTLKNYLNKPLKEFIKKENIEKIDELGLDKDSLFKTLISELIFEYYEYIYSNQNELNKYLLDKKFVIRNEKFSKEGLINLNYFKNSKKVYGYLDFFNITIGKNNKSKFRISHKNEFH